MRSFAEAARLYRFTEKEDARLVEIYRGAQRMGELRSGLAAMSVDCGIPRGSLCKRAAALGLRFVELHKWSKPELDFLRVNAGFMSTHALSRHLKRSPAGIKQRLAQLKVSAVVSDGYTRKGLMQRFGVCFDTLALWIREGWLALDESGRIPSAAVERFVWEHMDAYRMASCEEEWLKQMLRTWIERQAMERMTVRHAEMVA